MRIPSYFTIMVVTLTLSACGGSRSVEDDVVVEGLAGDELAVGDISASVLDDDSTFDTYELEDTETEGSEAIETIGAIGAIASDLLNQRVIYFDYDSSLLTPENEAIVRAHAEYMKTEPKIQIVLEGHTDERGTREYNLALGESRAKAVSRVMQALGLSSNRFQTISYGEERPVSMGSTKSAWSLNRRVEILYP